MSIISNWLRIDLWRVFFILLLCKKNKDKNIKRLGKNSTKLCFMYISKTLPYLEIGRHKICRRINFKFGMLWITIFCNQMSYKNLNCMRKKLWMLVVFTSTKCKSIFLPMQEGCWALSGSCVGKDEFCWFKKLDCPLSESFSELSDGRKHQFVRFYSKKILWMEKIYKFYRNW